MDTTQAPTTAADTASTATTAVTAPPAGTEIILKHPFINAAGERVYRLVICRGKRADLKAAARAFKDDVDQETYLFSRLTGMTMEDIDQLDLADNKQLGDAFRAMVG